MIVSTERFVLPLLVLSAAFTAYGQGQPPTKVGVIQIQSAIVGTKEGQKAAADLETRFAPKKKDLDKKQADLRSLQEQLQKGGNAMSEAAKQDLMRNIDQKTKSYNRDMEDAQAEYEQEQQKVLSELGQKMMAVIDRYARDNGYSIILDVSNPNTPVLYASNTVDITKQIVELYDKASVAAPTSGTGSGASAAPKPAAIKPTTAPSKPAPAPVKKPGDSR